MRSAIARASAPLPFVVAILLLLAGCGEQEPSSQSSDRATPQSGPDVEKLWTFDEEPAGAPPRGSEVFAGD